MDMRIRFDPETAGASGDVMDDARPVAGNGLLLRDVLAANYQRLHRRLQRHLGCADQASDSLHEAWLRLCDMRLPSAVQNPEAYVYRVACNAAIDQLRNHRWHPCIADTDKISDDVTDPAPGPDAVAEARCTLTVVDRAMRQLPHRHQEVLMALRVEEQTRHQVAARHGISLRRVDTILRQALDHCASVTSRHAMAGVRSTRRALPLARRA